MKRESIDDWVKRHGAEAIVSKLHPFLSEERRGRIETVLAGRLASLKVAVEDPYDPHNAAAVVRSAEALGATGVHVIRASERILRSKKLTTGTHHWIDTAHHEELDAFFAQMRMAGMKVAGACVHGENNLSLEALPVEEPLCLLFGNEHRGLTLEAQAVCDYTFRIPIYGFAESYNLSVAAAISLYSVSGRMREAAGRDGDLSEEERDRLRARWYLRSVDERLATGLFGRQD